MVWVGRNAHLPLCKPQGFRGCPRPTLPVLYWRSRKAQLTAHLFILMKPCEKSEVKVLVARLCLAFWDPMGRSPPGSSVHGILQARTLEWVAMPSSRGSSQLKDRTWDFCIAGGLFTIYTTREAPQNALLNSLSPLLRHTAQKKRFFSKYHCSLTKHQERWWRCMRLMMFSWLLIHLFCSPWIKESFWLSGIII